MTIVFVALFLILLFAVFLAWPVSGLYALALSLPIIGWNFDVRGFTLPLADLIALIALIAFASRLLHQQFFTVKNPIKLKWPLLLPFAIFLLIGLISAILADNPLAALWSFTRWSLFLYLAYLLLPYNLITSGRILKRTIAALILSALVVLASGYLSLFGQDWRDSFFRIKSIAWFAIFPFGENHNLIAEFLNVGAFFWLAAREFLQEVRKKRWCDVAFALTSLGIILTFSRAGWITLFLQIIVYVWYKTAKQDRLKMVLAGLGVVIILSPLVWKMSQLQQDNVSSTENRWLLTEISLRALAERPYFGFGSGEFINLVDDNIRFKAKYGEAIDSHGMLQKVLAENGIFGLAAWIFILISLLKIAGENLRRYYRDYPWILALGLAAAGGLFFQFFNTSYYKGKVWVPIAIFLAAVRLLEIKYERNKEQRKIE